MKKQDLTSIGLSREQEQQVLKRYIIYSIIITLFYGLLAISNYIINHDTVYLYSFIATVVISAIFGSYFIIKNHLFAKNYITIIFSLTTIFSFYSFNGITGLFTIDFVNIVIFTFIIFNIKSLLRYGVFFFLLLGSLTIIQLFDLITFRERIFYFNEKVDAAIFVFSRLILTINMILYLKSRYNVERINLMKKNVAFENLTNKLKLTNKELKVQNEEVNRQKKFIDQQNYQLKTIQQELIEANNSLENRIFVRTEELVNVNTKLKKTLKQLDQFVYSASHDLSAPLKSILGLVHIARLEDKNNNSFEHLKYIEKSILKQEKVIKDLLQYSRNNKNEIVYSTINLRRLINDLISDLSFYPGFDEIEFKTDLAIDQIVFDESRLVMILNNLLNNAIKYRDQDKEQCHVILTSQKSNGKLIFEVKDNGLGISKNHETKIFDMFYRANEASDGSGLGLFIVAEAVEKLNGTITVKSEEKTGSTFTLKFQYEEDKEPIKTISEN